MERDRPSYRPGLTGCKEADKARCGPVVLPGVFRDLVFPGGMIGTIRIGVDSSCDVFSSAPSIVSQIRWCSEGTEKCPQPFQVAEEVAFFG